MEIIEFIVGCFEALAAWRLSLMIVLGVALGALLLFLLPAEPLNMILAGVAFVGCFLHGIYWQRSAERRGS